MLHHLRAFAEALYSDGVTPPPAARIDWLMSQMEDFLGRAGPQPRFVFFLALAVASFLAPVMVFRFPTLSRLDVATRVRALTRMEESFASAPVLAVKAFLCTVYYEHPDVQREVGHVGRSTFPARPP